MWIFIEPSDVWMFRTGQPFDAGSDHRAASLFPPNPSTVYGAICAAILTHLQVDLHKFKLRDTSDPNVKRAADLIGFLGSGNIPAVPSTIRLEGPFLAAQRDEPEGNVLTPYFPAPADLLEIKKKKGEEDSPNPLPLAVLAPSGIELITNWPQDYEGLKPLEAQPTGNQPASLLEQGIKSLAGSWISGSALEKYLKGDGLNTNDVVPASSLFRFENRLGIGLSADKKSDDGLIYQTRFVRPEVGVGLLVNVSMADGAELPADAFPSTGRLSLGGERKAASYKRVDEPGLLGTLRRQKVTGKSKLLFLTDTKLDQGWTSLGWQKQLVAACVPGHNPIGGWDVAQNRQKPMKRYVPAGSVYYFSDSPAVTEAYTKKIDDQSLAPFGYGQAILIEGNW